MTRTTNSNPTLVLGICLISAALMVVGCHRGYYRRMADAEARKLVDEKTNDPRWSSATANIEIDPQSRMFDPFSKDHPPLPPDDPASNEYMNRVDGRKGYPHWHANGDTCYVESPEWKGYLPMDSQGRVIIDINTAIELSLIHSDDLQRQREELYLSALDVAIQRFGFDSQYFAGYNAFFGTEGRFRSGASRSTLAGSFGSSGNGLSYRKLGITGANFVVGLANSVLWNFAGPNTQTASSLINFTITQPLLRNAGRERIMESLTISERALLGNVRAMERFRQGFFLEIVSGRQSGPGPSRGGNFLSLPTSASTQAGGILGLLQTQQQIRYAEFNVIQQVNSLTRLRELNLADQITYLQVQQTEISLYSQQQNLLNLKVNYQNSLDRFKITLGLPPDLDMIIKDPFLDQFILISDEVLEAQSRISDLRLRYGTEASNLDESLRDLELKLEKAAENPDQKPDPNELNLPADAVAELKRLQSFVEESVKELENVDTVLLPQIKKDFDRLAEVRPQRLAYLEKLRSQIETGEIPADIETDIVSNESVASVEDLQERLDESLKALEDVKSELKNVSSRIQKADEIPKIQDPEERLNAVQDHILSNIASQLTTLNSKLTELSLVQVLARSNSIEMADIDLDSEEATAIARCFRLDWMNARAGLVDSWRQIEFVADQLESQFDLVLEGSIGSVDDNPFRIRYENGNLRGGFRFDSPIVRMSERNQYRQTLINYQRARRTFYQFEDEIKRNLRLTIRTINLNKTSFELQRRSLRASVQNLEQSNLVLEQPPRFQAGGARTSTLGSTTARDLTGAINQLNQAQSQFLNSWLTYEVLRQNLDYDLGTIQVDPSGHWIEPGKIDRDIGYRVAAQMGIDASCLDCNLPFDQTFQSLDAQKDRPDDGKQDAKSRPSSSPSVAPAADPLAPTDPANPPLGLLPNLLRAKPMTNANQVQFQQLPTK